MCRPPAAVPCRFTHVPLSLWECDTSSASWGVAALAQGTEQRRVSQALGAEPYPGNTLARSGAVHLRTMLQQDTSTLHHRDQRRMITPRGERHNDFFTFHRLLWQRLHPAQS